MRFGLIGLGEIERPCRRLEGDGRIFSRFERLDIMLIRPDGARDPHGVADAQARLRDAYRFLEDRLNPAPWLTGEVFTMADCSAAPALFYANAVLPFAEDSKSRAYLERLTQRRSFARVLAEAEPYFNLFPMPQKLTAKI